MFPPTRTREATRTVCQPVQVNKTRTVMVPQVQTRTVNYTVHKPVWRTEEVAYTVNVPYQETRTATRQVCQMVPEVRTCTVTRDRGSWQAVACPTPHTVAYRGTACGADGCATGCQDCAPATRMAWVPNLVAEQVQYTVMRPQYTSQPYEYTVTLCRQEQRTRPVQRCELVAEQQSREVQHTVLVPQQQEYVATEIQQIQQPYTYQVCVLKPETRTRQFQVCRMVSEQQTREVPYTVCVPQQQEYVATEMQQASNRTRIKCA